MRTRGQTIAARKTLLDLPPEIFTILEAYLEIREIASFLLTCRLIKQRIERFLYKKVFITSQSSNTSTRHFVALLNRRPEIVHWIFKFVIYEYDIEYFSRLLAFTFPNLINLILAHEGSIVLPSCGRRKLNALNAMVRPQPALLNLDFDVEQQTNASALDHELYYLNPSAISLFRHPKLVRARLSHLDFTAFDRLPEDSFCHSKLSELILERCRFSAKNLRLFVNPCISLGKLWLSQNQSPLYPQSELPTILHSVKDTLRVLKTDWGHIAPLPEKGVDLRGFPNLHAIIMHPKLLLGKEYMVLPKQQLLGLIKSTLPPNLMILILEGIVPVTPKDVDTGPAKPAIDERHFSVRDEDQPIPKHDMNLMQHLLTEKENVAPKLEWLAVQYLERMQSVPEDIIALAKRKKVKCCPLYAHDEIAPPRDMSKHRLKRTWDDKERGDDDDASGFCTILDHSRGMMSWPQKPAGNL